MIFDPSFESLELSSKIYKMSKDINKNIHFIINKADEQQYEIIKEKITDKSAIVGYINNNKDILMSGLQGEPIKYSGNEIKNIINKLSK